MFYGSILFRFVGVVTIWLLKSIFSLKIQSFKSIWQGGKTKDSEDLIDHASSELIQIFVGAGIMLIFVFYVTGIFNQIF